jgi:hypothetical protein
MSTIVIDAATRERLLAAGGVVEVRDEGGELVGKFIAASPAGGTPRLRQEWYTAGEVQAFLEGMKRALS